MAGLSCPLQEDELTVGLTVGRGPFSLRMAPLHPKGAFYGWGPSLLKDNLSCEDKKLIYVQSLQQDLAHRELVLIILLFIQQTFTEYLFTYQAQKNKYKMPHLVDRCYEEKQNWVRLTRRQDRITLRRWHLNRELVKLKK